MKTALFFSAVLVLVASSVECATLRVDRNGNGDFTTIQSAVDAAAAGDTIRIGAGRYLDYVYTSINGVFSTNVYVNVRVNNLTLIGDGPTATIIGPTSLHAEPPYGPIGILVLSGVEMIRIESLSIEHIYYGIYRSRGRLEITHSALRGCQTGVVAWTDGGLEIDNTEFSQNTFEGVAAYSVSRNINIAYCQFTGNYASVYFDSAQNGRVSQCTFSGGRGGVTYSEGATGTVVDCNFYNPVVSAVMVADDSHATLERNSVIGGANGFRVEGLSHIDATDNWLQGQTYSGLQIFNSTLAFRENQIVDQGRIAVQLPTSSYFSPPIVEIDLSGNYWGTEDPARIDELIWDGNDDPRIHAIVVYQPVRQLTGIQGPPVAQARTFRSFPNPFNPQTVVRYDLQHSTEVSLRAFDLRGRLVRTLLTSVSEEPGQHEVVWDGRDESGAALPSGTYVLRLETGGAVQSLRVSLVR